jgi:ell wall binding domain 2 (CWB2)
VSRTPILVGLVILLAFALIGVSIFRFDKDDDPTTPGVGVRASDEDAAEQLGFPTIATKGTTRVGGADAVADVAGTVNAVFPATSDRNRPRAVVLVDKEDWQSAVAASVLMASPLRAPTLLTNGSEMPPASADTLGRLNPRGADLARDAQVIRIGERTPKPGDRKTAIVRGNGPFELAAAIDRFSSSARGEPSGDVLIASGERAPYAMPAAAWAARSGDSVLFARRNSLPGATRTALQAHEKPNIWVIGPEAVIGKEVEKALARLGRVRRIDGPTPVQNAIAFARFDRGGFGWGITVPGQNFTIASIERPADAAAAAPLAGEGEFAPLLLTDSVDKVPASLESYLLDVQPGYEDDPNASVFNHAWLLGDEKTISLAAQGRYDEITELIPVSANEP